MYFFIGRQNCNTWTFRFPRKCSKVLNLLLALGMSRKGNILFSYLKKIHFSISNEKQTKNTREMGKPNELSGLNSLSPNIASDKILLRFLSDDAYFASWHQCCLYIRQSIKHIYQNSENAYNYYAILLLGLISLFILLIQWLYENECHLTNKLEGRGLIGCSPHLLQPSLAAALIGCSPH